LGKLTDERFMFLSGDYETEQKTLRERLMMDKKECAANTEKIEGVTKFVSIIKQYENLQTLDEATVIKLIDKIVVHERKKVYGEKMQKIEIYYNFIGAA